MEYGIVANVIEPDRVLRKGAKVWLASGTGGEGWHRFEWIGRSRSGRIIEKWAPTFRFNNFRAAWIPEHLRTRVTYMRGTKPEMEIRAKELNEWADEQRALHPGRQIGKPADGQSTQEKSG